MQIHANTVYWNTKSSVSFSFLANISPLSKSTSNPSKSNLEISKTPHKKCTKTEINSSMMTGSVP
jgi:hypothetical protein